MRLQHHRLCESSILCGRTLVIPSLHKRISVSQPGRFYWPLRSPIPAVKITGDATTSAVDVVPSDKSASAPLSPKTNKDDEMMLPVSLCPDPCLSATTKSSTKKKDQEKVSKDIDVAAALHKTSLPSLLSDQEVETEFDAFLLDAVQWL